MLKKLMLLLIAVSSVMAFSASNAFAYYGGYCGPPVTSKSEMISYLQSPAGRALAQGAETYVRAHAGYYHIQADQGFISWLQMPNVKFFKAPAGYTLTGNTYCPGNTPEPYYGHYSVGGLGMMWWCTDSSGGGHNCVPITKGYCHNWVMGHPIRPMSHHCTCHKPKPRPKHKKHPKPTPTTCAPGQMIGSNGNCVNQTQNVSQQCGNGTVWNGQECVSVQSNCSNVNTGNGSPSQGGNCNSGTTTTTCSGTSTNTGSGNAGNCDVCSGTNNCNTTVTPPPSVVITSYTALNQVPAGYSSAQAPFTVNASDPGSVTVNPGIGAVSDCNGGPEKPSITFQLIRGNNPECVTYYAPNDSDQPTSDSLTYTAIVTTAGGTATDQKVDTFQITYPTRP